jgi:hypothetical protein
MKLCQRDTASCGACCGLYNRADPSRGPVRAELGRRTRALAEVPRTAEAFRGAARRLEAEGPAPLFPSVRVCPLLGFLDAGETRVGCLAHPAATGGPDLRDCGVYDRSTCETFLCPSFSWLTEEEAEIAGAATAGDFHLYGLAITDVPFLRAVLAAVADGAGARVEARHLGDGGFRETLRALLALKEELAPGSEGLFGAFAAGPTGDEVPRRIDYASIGRAGSRYDAILTCAGADPRSGNDLDRLEAEVRRRLDAAVRAFAASAGAAG